MRGEKRGKDKCERRGRERIGDLGEEKRREER